jgi:hypothetical protein
VRGVKVDHTGITYGSLTALRFSRHRKVNGSGALRTKPLWWVRCVCGKEYEICAHSLRSGHAKSCGCMKGWLLAHNRRLSEEDAILNRAYTQHRHGARRRGLTTELTREQFVEIVRQPCTYCGSFSHRKLQFTQNIWHEYTMPCNSVDRRNNEPHYNLGNSVPCCFVCQKMKSILPAKDFLTHAAKVAEYQTKCL